VPKTKAEPHKTTDRHLIISPSQLRHLEDACSFPFHRSAIANGFDSSPNPSAKVVGAAKHGARRVGVAVIDDKFDGDFLDEARHCTARKMSLRKAVIKKPSVNATIKVR
jgi:hypothetical protein